jgi:hypothetical protein
MKRMKLSVYWPDCWKSVILTKEEWEEILSGNEFSKGGKGYYYDGEKFYDDWWFEGGIDGEVIVTYGDGGTGYEGTLSDEEIIKKPS